MNRSITKIRHIQESNLRLEKRLLNEQDNDLVGKTITIFSDRDLTQQLAVVRVNAVNKGNNSAGISFNLFKIDDFTSVESLTINCNSNIVILKTVSIMPGNVVEKTKEAYVSQKLVDFLKPTICQQSSTQQTQPKADF